MSTVVFLRVAHHFNIIHLDSSDGRQNWKYRYQVNLHLYVFIHIVQRLCVIIFWLVCYIWYFAMLNKLTFSYIKRNLIFTKKACFYVWFYNTLNMCMKLPEYNLCYNTQDLIKSLAECTSDRKENSLWALAKYVLLMATCENVYVPLRHAHL